MPNRKAPPAPLEYLRRWPMQLWLLIVFLFLYLPLLTLIAFSFNESRRNIVWTGFTTEWYVKAFSDESLMTAFGNSLTIALAATILSLILGTMVGILMWRFRFPGKGALEGGLALPIVVPEISMGVAMLVFFAKVLPWPAGLPWPLNLGAIIIAHTSFCFPFVAIVIRARLASFNRQMEEAAKDLGASEWQAMRDVVIPHLKPALVAGALLAFTLSLDDFVITFFTSGPDTITFPVKVYSMARFSPTPAINAASTVLILLTVILTAIALTLQTKADQKAKTTQ
jgi:spermidine/putrescine transport system permease protein